MSLSDLEQHVLAYFVAEHAETFNFADRFYPHGELTMIWEDKINVATRKFGAKVRMKSKAVAAAFLDLLIEKGAYSTRKNDFGGTMHSFQQEEFRKVVKVFKETDPIIQQAKAGGPDFWTETFAGLAAA